MARVMYFECFAGAAGDMTLAALLDAGLPLEVLQSALGSLTVDHELRVSRVVRAGIAATHVEVIASPGASAPAAPTTHAHPHGPDAASHGHPPHRTLHEIQQLIGQSALTAAAKTRARAMFRRLGDVEAAVHDMPLDQIHLHEVGAIDSIIDICGVVVAMEWFGIDDVVVSPMNVGGGTVKIAHGTFPVPAPATLRLLTGVPVYSRGPQVELVTPTGALVMSTYAGDYGPMPAMAIERVGYGAGTKDFDGFPNVLRVSIGERTGGVSPAREAGVSRIECEIDDMTPEQFGPVIDHMLAAGALDAFLTPIVMKKGRPATLLTVLAPAVLRAGICDRIFRETTTIGVRFDDVDREVLERRWETVDLPGGQVRIKVAGRGGEIFNAAPEFEDCQRLAASTGRPLKRVQAEAMHAWLALEQGRSSI
jgi:uncharacterized protein (TIGR00299 family) protein